MGSFAPFTIHRPFHPCTPTLTTRRYCATDVDCRAREARRERPNPCARGPCHRRLRCMRRPAACRSCGESWCRAWCTLTGMRVTIVHRTQAHAEIADLDERQLVELGARAPRREIRRSRRPRASGLLSRQPCGRGCGPSGSRAPVSSSFRATRVSESTASSSSMRPLRPVSSCSSRNAACSGCSPNSTPPPGSVHQPGRSVIAREAAHQETVLRVEAHVVCRDRCTCGTVQVPSNCASRFSRNAFMPSTRSGDVVASDWKWPSRSSESDRSVSNERFNSVFDKPSDRVGPAASLLGELERDRHQLVGVVDTLVCEAHRRRPRRRSRPRRA